MSKQLDLWLELNKYINSQEPFARCEIGILKEKDSMSIMPMPGGNEIMFMDGSRDKTYNVQINAKSKTQINCINQLTILTYTLERLTQLESGNGSFGFRTITVTSAPSLVSVDESGYYIYVLSAAVEVTIEKGVDE